MENLNFTPKGIKREARGLLTDNWSRALAVVCMSLFALAIFLLMNQFVLALLDTSTLLSDTYSETDSLKTVADFYHYYTERGINLNTFVSVVLAGFYFLFVSPLNLGSVGWYQSLAQCSQLQVGQVFFYYRSNDRFVDALVFELARVGRHILYGGLCLLPSAVCLGLSLGYAIGDRAGQGSAMPLAIAGAALFVAGLIVYALVILRFFVARYLFVNENGYSVGRCFSTSKRYMRGNVGRVLRVILSFIPWFVSCLAIAPAVFVVPFYNASLAAAAQDIIDANTPT